MKFKQLLFLSMALFVAITTAKRHKPLTRPTHAAKVMEQSPMLDDSLHQQQEFVGPVQQSDLDLLVKQPVLQTSSGPNSGKKPKVQKFMGDIYSEMYYSDSALNDYIYSFYAGYNMQDYAFAEECL